MSETELLAVLDMSEDEQIEYLTEQGIICLGRMAKYEGGGAFLLPESLADLAFRLRDEAIEKDLDWDDALILVWEKLGRSIKYQVFCKYYAKPIHWIIAALIAKEKEDG